VHEAAGFNRFAVLRCFRDKDESNFKKTLLMKDVDGTTPTMLAIKNDADECAEVLLQTLKLTEVNPGKNTSVMASQSSLFK
jgi:hypothetical protein